MPQFKKGHPPAKTKPGRRSLRGKYILGYTLRRKGAKRHILARYDTLDEAMDALDYSREFDGGKAEFHIYNGMWEVIE